ncbi:hypothetical protein NQ317_008816 [Molorchus minor]|uniref:Uncharacterized protein n=1 Tax=Molorchus minor TaxID=1323400 RepID=A0ABQ9J1G6_9CUCU|nr:hypothetical protein NQ317_008816 [Molorchus minor]
MLVMFKESYKTFQQNAISFVTETTYLDWNTTFPAITICPIAGSEPEWDNQSLHYSRRILTVKCKSSRVETHTCCVYRAGPMGRRARRSPGALNLGGAESLTEF